MTKVDQTAITNVGLVATGIGIGIVIGWLTRGRLYSGTLRRAQDSFSSSISKLNAEETISERPIHPDDEIKLVLVVRNDLKMGKGKAAAQCSHASVMAYESCAKKSPDLLKLWRYGGQRKVVVKCDDETQLKTLRKTANEIGLLTSVVCDAGHTQVAAGSRTVLGVGPAPSSVVDAVTGHLKLY